MVETTPMDALAAAAVDGSKQADLDNDDDGEEEEEEDVELASDYDEDCDVETETVGLARRALQFYVPGYDVRGDAGIYSSAVIGYLTQNLLSAAAFSADTQEDKVIQVSNIYDAIENNWMISDLPSSWPYVVFFYSRYRNKKLIKKQEPSTRKCT